MKRYILQPVNVISLLIISMLFTVVSFGQDKKVDINVNTKSGNDNLFAQPWVWVVGGALFILLLVALLRSNKN